ncbi:MAG: hypothetical protein K1060chlam1_00287 [Candidatus Anoxychlamydiales bacterium]|nr:hypothetical protein [Candidatus Anoxychlamydiales bacterium]
MHEKAKATISKKHLICFADFKFEEIPSHFIKFAQCAKEFTILFLIVFIALRNLHLPVLPFILIFSFSFFILKIFLVAFLAWTKLQRLHKIIEDKKWHIEHKREETKAQLEEIYRAKGFSDKLLTDIVDTLTSDDNRLLQTMLEEEMGLSLGYFIHPIKQAFGAFLGMFLASIVFAITFFILPIAYCFFVSGGINIIASSIIAAKYEKTKMSKEIVWDLAIAIVVLSTCHFLAMSIMPFFKT